MSLCCESTSDRDVIQGNSRFWAKEADSLVVKAWKKVTDMGIKGDDDYIAYA